MAFGIYECSPHLSAAEINANGVGFLATGIDFRMLLVRGADGDGANAGDSYLGIGAGLQSARLLGVDGLDFRASGTVKFNKATDASGTALSTRMNWTVATGAHDTDGVLLDLSILNTLQLEATGAAALDAFGFVVGKASFDVVLATTDITTGNASLGTLLDASLLSVTLSDLSLFAGAGAHLIVPADPANIAGYGIDTSDALGFSIAGGEVKLAIVKPGELAEGDRTSYTGLEIGFSGAQLEGVSPDLVFRASGTVLINKATGATGLEAPNRIDWAAATNDTNDPAHLIPAFSSNLTAGMKLRIEGAAALDIFGAVLGTASFSLTQATETIDTGNPDIGTLTDASVLAISLSNVNLFAGAGASLTVPADPTNVAGYGVNTTGALGFAVTGGAVDLAIVRPSGAAADQYIGLQASLAGASLVGVDGLRFIASGTVLVNKTTAASNEKINWATATGEILPEFNPLLGADTDLAIIDGHASLDLFGFVVGMADFSILQGTTTVHTGNPAIGASGTLTDASVMVVTLSNLNLFAGAGAALNDNGTPADTSDDAIDRNGAIGFDISGGMVTLDVVRPAASGASYTGLSVGASGSLGGIPGLTLSVTGTILVNKATGAAPTQRIDWATRTTSCRRSPA